MHTFFLKRFLIVNGDLVDERQTAVLILTQHKAPDSSVVHRSEGSPGLIVGHRVLQVHPQDVQGAGQQLQGQVEQSDPQACPPIAEKNKTVSDQSHGSPVSLVHVDQ